jgi:hypothetical protein
MVPQWLVQVFHLPQKFEIHHFGMVEATGLKSMALRSLTMA